MQDSLSFMPASIPSYSLRSSLCKWQGTPKGPCHFAFLDQCGGLSLAGCLVPTKSALSLPSSSGQGRENIIQNIIKGLLSKRQEEITHPLPLQAKQTGLEEMSWIYHQPNQSRTLRYPQYQGPAKQIESPVIQRTPNIHSFNTSLKSLKATHLLAYTKHTQANLAAPSHQKPHPWGLFSATDLTQCQ